jgi:hypothetical protein
MSQKSVAKVISLFKIGKKKRKTIEASLDSGHKLLIKLQRK